MHAALQHPIDIKRYADDSPASHNINPDLMRNVFFGRKANNKMKPMEQSEQSRAERNKKSAQPNECDDDVDERPRD